MKRGLWFGVSAQAGGAAGGSTEHRYWRIWMHDSGDPGTFTGVSNIELRNIAGGADLTGSGTASASSGTAANAFDNNSATDWITSVGTTDNARWISYDFGSGNEYEIVEVVITARDHATDCDQAPTDWHIEYSDDGSTWTPVWGYLNCSTYTQAETRVFTRQDISLPCRTWGFIAGDYNSNEDTWIEEIEFRASVSGPDETGTGTAFSNVGTAADAFDGSTGTRWQSTLSGAVRPWIAYDFGAGDTQTIVECFIDRYISQFNFDVLFFASEDAAGAASSGGVFIHCLGYYEEPCASGNATLDVGEFTSFGPTPQGIVASAGSYAVTGADASLYGPNDHRYWRIRFFNEGTSSSTENVVASEVQLRNVASGSDLTGSGTASAHAAGGGAASNAFDNNFSTAWGGANSEDMWLAYDFGAGNRYDIVEVVITSLNSTGFINTGKDFIMEWSDDGSTWTPSWGYINTTTYAISETRTFTKPTISLPCRTWGMFFRGAQGGGTNSIKLAEIEMRASASGPDETGAGTAFADPRTRTAASNAFDNNNATDWYDFCMTYQTPWIAYDFGAGDTQEIVEVALTSPNASYATFSPTAWDVFYSDGAAGAASSSGIPIIFSWADSHTWTANSETYVSTKP